MRFQEILHVLPDDSGQLFDLEGNHTEETHTHIFLDWAAVVQSQTNSEPRSALHRSALQILCQILWAAVSDAFYCAVTRGPRARGGYRWYQPLRPPGDSIPTRTVTRLLRWAYH
jgi:hypothetical protein